MVVESEHVKDVMLPGIETIGPDEPVRVARRRMESTTDRSLIVADGTHPIGIVAWRAISNQNRVPADAPVSEFMTRDFPTITPDMPLSQAQNNIAGVDIDNIPVVNEEGQLVGVVPRPVLAHIEQAAHEAPIEEVEPAGTQPPTQVMGPGQTAVSTPAEAAGPELRTGMGVVGSKGDKLGTLSEVLADPTGRATTMVVEHGLLRKKHKRVPVDSIAGVSDGTVTLSIDGTEFGFLPNLEDQGS
ncbi:MAG TPA: CBS domain-containing protein [Thermomicrobiaceae bacterium]|nr:CBS domain-containing protein [Thermomicrobiaceae bacterium]